MAHKGSKGFTFVELVLATLMVSMIVGVLAAVFQAMAATWAAQGSRIGLGLGVNRGIEMALNDIRRAKDIYSVNNDEIRFTTDGTTYYIYYLYNTADGYPPAFGQASYQLRKAALTGGRAGTFAYGSGDMIARDILPPPDSDISYIGKLVTMDLSGRRGSSVSHLWTNIKPRNL